MKFRNGVMEVKLKNTIKLTQEDIMSMCFLALGASVSNMPANYHSRTETDKLELFDPERVTNPEELPEYWRKVWALHNQPGRRACVDFRYRYVHVPFNILPQFPRVPCKGIFCLDSRKVSLHNIAADDLIHVGTSVDEGW